MDTVQRLVVRARRLLAEGSAPSDVFAQLAASGRDLRNVALVVCLAVGVPRAVAEQRLDVEGDNWDDIDGDEHLSRDEHVAGFADALRMFGLFDPHVELSEEQQRIAARFGEAVREIGFIRGGVWLGYSLAVRQGRLRKAFVMLAEPGGMGREVDTSAYWARLVGAAELLGHDGDAEYVEAVRRCRERLARAGG